MSEALDIGYDGSLVCMIDFKIRPALLSVVADVGKVLCCITGQGIPRIESMLPSLCNCSSILTILNCLIKRNLFQFVIQLPQRLPQQWQVALT
jgi:hypothetical protein